MRVTTPKGALAKKLNEPGAEQEEQESNDAHGGKHGNGDTHVQPAAGGAEVHGRGNGARSGHNG